MHYSDQHLTSKYHVEDAKKGKMKGETYIWIRIRNYRANGAVVALSGVRVVRPSLPRLRTWLGHQIGFRSREIGTEEAITDDVTDHVRHGWRRQQRTGVT